MQMHYNSKLNFSDKYETFEIFFKRGKRDININIVTNIVPYMY